jgi:outer membrane lipoprotein LolB
LIVCRLALLWLCAALLAACATTPRAPLAPAAEWGQRSVELQKATAWAIEGRAAVAYREQGWQASLNWQQRDGSSEVHLSGPFGVGALVLKRSADGLSLNGAPPSEAVTAQLQERLGFELPLDHLRFWLMGVPDPSAAFEVTRNAEDRALHLTQADWSIDYDRYMAVAGDVLPAHLVLSREGVRVRIAVDHWEAPR